MPRLYESASDPGVTDDGSKAYRAGDTWRNTTDNGLFQLLDALPGAAVWSEISQTLGGSGVFTNVDAGASGTAGSVDVFPSTAAKGKLAVTCTDQTGDTTVSLVAGAMAAARTVTLRDPGAAASILTTTDSTAAATAATAVEITRTCDASARLIAAGGTLAMSEATHEGKIICLDTAAGSVVTLPASTGGGGVYKFLVTVTATSNSHVIKVANASDEFRGYVVQDADEATAPNIWWAADNNDTITLNRTTTGLAAQGEYFEIVDAVLNHYYVQGYSQASGTEATPFSATV